MHTPAARRRAAALAAAPEAASLDACPPTAPNIGHLDLQAGALSRAAAPEVNGTFGRRCLQSPTSPRVAGGQEPTSSNGSNRALGPELGVLRKQDAMPAQSQEAGHAGQGDGSPTRRQQGTMTVTGQEARGHWPGFARAEYSRADAIRPAKQSNESAVRLPRGSAPAVQRNPSHDASQEFQVLALPGAAR